jgi:TPR repeat protein
MIQDFEVSADLGSPNGKFVVGWMAEHGIGIPVDFVAPMQNYEMSSDGSAPGSACCGWCLYAGKKASDSNDANGANNFGCCLKQREGVDEDIERAVLYYRKVASQSHPHG